MPGRVLLRKIFGSLVWNIQTKDPVLFLTFDDGPVREVTPWVLEQLDVYGAKATFFCTGDNVRKHPGIYKLILEKGHVTGNHTFHHLNGWKAKNTDYFSDVEKCSLLVHSVLFRPPYGRIMPGQINKLKSKYKIVMWDVLSKDYDERLTGEDCLDNVIQNTRAGSIIVFHDSLKARERIQVALPLVLKHFSARGYRFCSLSDEFLR